MVKTTVVQSSYGATSSDHRCLVLSEGQQPLDDTPETHTEGFNLLIRTIPEIHQLICHRPIKENTYYSEM